MKAISLIPQTTNIALSDIEEPWRDNALCLKATVLDSAGIVIE